MRRALKLLLNLGMALASGAARADIPQEKGFNSTDLTNAAMAVDPNRAELAIEAERLRLAIAYDPAAAIGLRDANGRRAIAAALKTGAGAADARARWFMAGAIAKPGGPTQSIFYNPLSHGWLTIDWYRSTEGKWEIAAALATSSSAPGLWTTMRGPYLSALFEDYVRTYAQIGLQPSGQAEAEADRWLSELAAWQTPERLRLVEDVRKTIASAKSGTALDLVPARLRASFVPVAGFTRTGGAPSLLLGSPLMPGLFLAADFDMGAKNRHLTFVNLTLAGAGK